MRIHLRSALPLALAFLGVAAVPTLAAAKCTPNDGRPVLREYLFVLDGRAVGEYEFDDGPAPIMPAAEDIYSIDHVCVDSPRPEAGGARQVVMIVVTRSGFADAAQLALAELVEAQQEYHERHGRYASEVTELNVVGLGKYVPFSMVGSPDGFAAQISSEPLSLRCAVALGSARELVEPLGLSRAQARGTPACRRR